MCLSVESLASLLSSLMVKGESRWWLVAKEAGEEGREGGYGEEMGKARVA